MPAPMPPRREPSTQHEHLPESVTPADARRDATAELGAEGGSYGELTQSVRSEREWDPAAERQATWRLAPAAFIVLLIAIAVILAVMFWAVAA